MQEFNLKLNENQVTYLLQLLGNLPTQSGAFPFFEEVRAQISEQLPKPEETPVEPTVEPTVEE